MNWERDVARQRTTKWLTFAQSSSSPSSDAAHSCSDTVSWRVDDVKETSRTPLMRMQFPNDATQRRCWGMGDSRVGRSRERIAYRTTNFRMSVLFSARHGEPIDLLNLSATCFPNSSSTRYGLLLLRTMAFGWRHRCRDVIRIRVTVIPPWWFGEKRGRVRRSPLDVAGSVCSFRQRKCGIRKFSVTWHTVNAIQHNELTNPSLKISLWLSTIRQAAAATNISDGMCRLIEMQPYTWRASFFDLITTCID